LPQTLATKELAVALQQRSVSHFPFTGEFVTKHNMTVVPYPPYWPDFSVSPDRGWNYTAESQAVLNTLTEHDFRDVALRTKHTHRRGLLQVWWWPADPMLLLDQMAVLVPKIMDTICMLGNLTGTINILVVKQWWHLYAWSRESESSSEFSSSLPELPSPVITAPLTISIRQTLHSLEHLRGTSQRRQPYKKLLNVQRDHWHGPSISHCMLQT
jgi:hypothetical protein